MGMKSLGVLCSLGLAINTAAAQVYLCIDPSGHKEYTNVSTAGRQCQVVPETVSSVPVPRPQAPAAAAPRPTSAAVPGPVAATNPNYPKVDGATQKGRDDTRRKVLEDELAQEERMLGKARSDLGEQEKVRNGDERNYQRVLDRLKPYQDAVDRHGKNIEALRKELAALR